MRDGVWRCRDDTLMNVSRSLGAWPWMGSLVTPEVAGGFWRFDEHGTVGAIGENPRDLVEFMGGADRADLRRKDKT